MTDRPAPAIDLVCWDYGDTLVDQTFMRLAPDGVPEWSAVYESLLDERLAWLDEWEHGRATIHDLIEPLAERLPMMTRAEISRHLRAVWQRIEWFPIAHRWLAALDGKVLQAIVTVNPFEFSGISAVCGLDPLVDLIVTSADVADLSKVTMAERARDLLGLPSGLGSTLLIDNMAHNTEAFTAAGGLAYTFTIEGFERDAEGLLGPLTG